MANPYRTPPDTAPHEAPKPPPRETSALDMALLLLLLWVLAVVRVVFDIGGFDKSDPDLSLALGFFVFGPILVGKEITAHLRRRWFNL